MSLLYKSLTSIAAETNEKVTDNFLDEFMAEVSSEDEDPSFDDDAERAAAEAAEEIARRYQTEQRQQREQQQKQRQQHQSAFNGPSTGTDSMRQNRERVSGRGQRSRVPQTSMPGGYGSGNEEVDGIPDFSQGGDRESDRRARPMYGQTEGVRIGGMMSEDGAYGGHLFEEFRERMASAENGDDETTTNNAAWERLSDEERDLLHKPVAKVLAGRDFFDVLGLRRPRTGPVGKMQSKIEVTIKGNAKIVGIDRSAVKKAYRKLSLLVHPDKNCDPEAQDAFDLLQEAYETLADDSRRVAYQRLLKKKEAARRRNQMRRIYNHVESGIGIIKHYSTMRPTMDISPPDWYSQVARSMQSIFGGINLTALFRFWLLFVFLFF